MHRQGLLHMSEIDKDHVIQPGLVKLGEREVGNAGRGARRWAAGVVSNNGTQERSRGLIPTFWTLLSFLLMRLL